MKTYSAFFRVFGMVTIYANTKAEARKRGRELMGKYPYHVELAPKNYFF
jgi:hypothetical protein